MRFEMKASCITRVRVANCLNSIAVEAVDDKIFVFMQE